MAILVNTGAAAEMEYADGTREPARACWGTPEWLYEVLDLEFGFHLDAAASPENAKCGHYITLAEDALETDWILASGRNRPHVFLNPPYCGARYGMPPLAAWTARAAEQAAHGCLVVMLVPSDTGTRWFAKAAEVADEIRLITPRVNFEPPHADIRRSGNTGALAVIVYAPFWQIRGKYPVHPRGARIWVWEARGAA